MKRRWVDLVLVVGATVLAYVVITYRVYFGDHQLTIPFALKFADPSLFLNDITIDLYRHYSVMSFYFIRPITSVLGIETGFLVLHAVALVALFAAIVALARALSDEPWAPVFALMLFVMPKYVAGGVWTYDASFVSRHLANPLLLWGLWAVLRRKWIIAAILLGFGFEIHPVTALSAIIAATMLTLPRWREVVSKTGAAAVGIGIMLVIPVLLLRSGAAGESTLQLMDPHWADLVHRTNRDHFFPSDYSVLFLLPNAALVVLVWIGSTVIEDRATRLGVRLLAGVFILLFAVNAIFTEIVPVQAVMLASLMRYAVFVAAFAAVTFGCWLARIDRHPKLLWLAMGIAVPLASEYRIRSGWTAVIVVGLLLAVPVLRRWFERVPWWVWLGVCVFIVGRSHVSRQPFPYNSPVNREIVFAASAFLIGVLLMWGARRFPRLTSPPAIAAVLLLGLTIKAQAYYRFGHGIAQADIPNRRSDPLYELGLWARKNTPKDATFIEGPWNGFRATSQRSTYGNMLDGTYSNLSRPFAMRWEARMKALCRYENVLIDPCRWEDHDTESLRAMAEESGATYVIVKKDHQVLDLTLVHETDAFRIHAFR